MAAGTHSSREDRHLDFRRADLVAGIFGRSADHESGKEHGDDAKQQHAEEPGPGAPTITSSTIMLARRMPPLSGRKLSCIALTAPSEDAVETSANSADPAMPKRTSLPSMLPPGCCELVVRSTFKPGESRIAAGFR